MLDRFGSSSTETKLNLAMTVVYSDFAGVLLVRCDLVLIFCNQFLILMIIFTSLIKKF